MIALKIPTIKIKKSNLSKKKYFFLKKKIIKKIIPNERIVSEKNMLIEIKKLKKTEIK